MVGQKIITSCDLLLAIDDVDPKRDKGFKIVN
jgi:hypothetical protein